MDLPPNQASPESDYRALWTATVGHKSPGAGWSLAGPEPGRERAKRRIVAEAASMARPTATATAEYSDTASLLRPPTCTEAAVGVVQKTTVDERDWAVEVGSHGPAGSRLWGTGDRRLEPAHTASSYHLRRRPAAESSRGA